MDHANVMAKAVGPTALAREPTDMEMPLIVPRSEGSTALLVASTLLLMICRHNNIGRELDARRIACSIKVEVSGRHKRLPPSSQ